MHSTELITPTAEQHSKPPYQLFQRMSGRSSHEHPRVATSLELFFDLIFVVAIAFAGAQLHHALVADHVTHGLVSYMLVFFAIWWAWMGFTWFASAFDTDDVPYRLAVLVQMAGALVIAAGVPSAFENDWRLLTAGYVVMRVASIAQWLRATQQAPNYRKTAMRYAMGVLVVQLGWIGILFVPSSLGIIPFIMMVFAEFLVPLWAEKAGMTSWHPHHIAERYGLLTIIVLGESILAAVTAIQKAGYEGAINLSFILFCFGALLTVFCMWWIYFEDTVAEQLQSYKTAFYWGYGHYFVFASAAAVGAGLAAQVDMRLGSVQASDLMIGYGLAVPVVVFVIMTWLVHKRVSQVRGVWIYPVSALLILGTPWITGYTTILIGLVLAVSIALRLRIISSC